MSGKKELAIHYFQHDVNARNDIKLVKVLMECGLEGIGLWWIICEMLYEQKNILRWSELDTIAFSLRADTERIRAIIRVFCRIKLLVEDTADPDILYSPSVNLRLEMREEKWKNISEQNRQNVLKRWNRLRSETEQKENLDSEIENKNERTERIRSEYEMIPNKQQQYTSSSSSSSGSNNNLFGATFLLEEKQDEVVVETNNEQSFTDIVKPIFEHYGKMSHYGPFIEQMARNNFLDQHGKPIKNPGRYAETYIASIEHPTPTRRAAPNRATGTSERAEPKRLNIRPRENGERAERPQLSLGVSTVDGKVYSLRSRRKNK